MRSRFWREPIPAKRQLSALAFALLASACGSNDYYFLNDIKGEGDTVLFEFIYTCGHVEIEWDGSFGSLPHYSVNLSVKHDASADCQEDPREIAYDVGPIKQAFRQKDLGHPWPTPLGLRVPPYEEEQGALCLRNIFQDEPFKGKRCK